MIATYLTQLLILDARDTNEVSLYLLDITSHEKQQ